MSGIKFIFWLKIVFFGICIAQNHENIYNLLDENKNDTSFSRRCYEEGFKIRNSDPELTLKLAELGYHVARKCGNEFWMGKNLMLWGLGYYKNGHWKKAIPYYLSAIKIQKQIPDSTGLLYSYLNLGNALEEGKFYSQADSILHLALSLTEKLDKKADHVRILNNLGVLYAGIKEYPTALSLLFKARKEALTLNDYELLAMSCNNYAGVLLLIGEWQKARPWLEDALKYYTITENDFGRTDAMVNLFQINVREGLKHESEELLKEIEKNKKWLEVPQNKEEYLKWKSIFFALKGDSGTAFRLLLNHLNLADSLRNQITPTKSIEALKNYSKNNITFNYFILIIILLISFFLIAQMLKKN